MYNTIKYAAVKEQLMSKVGLTEFEVECFMFGAHGETADIIERKTNDYGWNDVSDLNTEFWNKLGFTNTYINEMFDEFDSM